MLYGNLTADPESITTKTGRKMMSFSVATNTRWKNKEGDMVAKADFHKIVVFGKLADIVGDRLHKGMPVLLVGKLRNRTYEAQDGSKRYSTEVVMDDFNFMPSKKTKEAEEETEEEPVEEVVAA